MMFEYAIREALGYADIFNTWYAPVLQSGKIDVIATTVGGNSPCVCNLTDDLVHGSLEQIDMLRRAEEQGASLAICTSVGEIALGLVCAWFASSAADGHDSATGWVRLVLKPV